MFAITTAVLVSANPASAHNTLLSSDPADGATLVVAPSQMTLVFDKSVPLETLSIDLIDASGVRSTLSGSKHGATGDTEVVTPLPPLPAGEVTTRWRLVGPDGHPITGRVSFTVAAPVATTQPATATTLSAGVPATAPAPTTRKPRPRRAGRRGPVR
ncbi:MAG: copper resistance protein CopC [Actinobacteria bacterium]|nr:copper resistance protein CopC [Actinomycetota bacterium]